MALMTFMVFYGRISSFLTVIDPNSCGLVLIYTDFYKIMNKIRETWNNSDWTTKIILFKKGHRTEMRPLFWPLFSFSHICKYEMIRIERQKEFFERKAIEPRCGLCFGLYFIFSEMMLFYLLTFWKTFCMKRRNKRFNSPGEKYFSTKAGFCWILEKLQGISNRPNILLPCTILN